LPIFGDILSNQSTPQFEALQWLADTDPANLSVDNTPLFSLQARFIVATLYFATNGVSWTNQCNFLTASDVCDWNAVDGKGVECTDVDQIRIDLGKYCAYSKGWQM